MKTIVTLHLYERTSSWAPGERHISQYDLRDCPDSMNERIWLGQQDVEIDWPEVDTRQAQIDSLERQVEKERAESQSRINLLLDRISKLKCLEHKE